jgi:hypothetical protein
MKKKLLCLALLFLTILWGCRGENVATNTTFNANTVNRPANNLTDTGVPTPTGMPINTGSNNITAANTKGNQIDKPKLTPTPQATPSPIAEKKKDEGLFSFPPPKATSVTEFTASELSAVVEQTMLSQIAGKLEDSLQRAGYGRDYYSYFSNDIDEFAIVTAMERINPDGSNFTADRWVDINDEGSLPIAGSGEYFRFLISGKKVYYRVFAFIVSARPERNRRSFERGRSPEFVTALTWKSKGESELGGGEPTPVASVVWSEKHRCYALVYLFVNHTSLDAPKSVDSLEKREVRLKSDLVTDADQHIKSIREKLGG